MKHTLLVLMVLGLWTAPVGAAPLTLTNEGVQGQTTVFRALLAGLGLTEIASISITDSNSGVGGSPGVFSGFDLDFVFLDLDGDFSTTGDRVFGSLFVFTTGTIRPTGNPAFQPSASRPGPTSGSSALNTIDHTLATLDTRDGFFPAAFNTDNVFGSLTLGDGGSLLIGLAMPVVLTGSEALFLGELGTDAGELIAASIEVSDQPLPVPEPTTVALLGVGFLGFSLYRRRTPETSERLRAKR